MRFLPRIFLRLRAEDGAVTVDWVVLTAAVIALGTAAGGAVLVALGYWFIYAKKSEA